MNNDETIMKQETMKQKEIIDVSQIAFQIGISPDENYD